MGHIIKLEHKVRVTHLSNTCEQAGHDARSSNYSSF